MLFTEQTLDIRKGRDNTGFAALRQVIMADYGLFHSRSLSGSGEGVRFAV